MFGRPDRARYDAIPAVIYTHPEVASAGRTEEQLKAAGIAYVKAMVPMGVAGRFLIENEKGSGFVKVLAGAKYGEILGVHAMGDSASEFIVAAAALIEMRATASRAGEVVFPHPTVSEALREAILAGRSQDIMTKALAIEPEQVFSREVVHPSRHPGQRLPARPLPRRRPATRHGGFPGHLAPTCAPSGSSRTSSTRSSSRAPIGASPTTTPGPPTCPWARRRRPWAWPSRWPRGPHLRVPPQPRRDPGQGLLGHPGAGRRRAVGDNARLSRRGRARRRWRRVTTAPCAGLAQRFFIYGAYGEIFARETGFNRGLGGSMHAFFAPFGIYPNNAIVGGSGSIAPGAALYKRANRRPGIVVANIGDASFGCGPVWEGITFASMDQYRKLWDQALGGGLPIIFNCMDNFYGMGGQPNGETMGQQLIARVGAGVNPEQMHTERVNGYNPLAVIDAFERKKQILAEGRGPVLLDTITYRFSGHSPSDASSYRSAEEVQHWQAADAIQAYRERLVDAGVARRRSPRRGPARGRRARVRDVQAGRRH